MHGTQNLREEHFWGCMEHKIFIDNYIFKIDE